MTKLPHKREVIFTGTEFHIGGSLKSRNPSVFNVYNGVKTVNNAVALQNNFTVMLRPFSSECYSYLFILIGVFSKNLVKEKEW